ncbi:type I restriction enzyme HsdR N-terminal domain-containing protein [Mongoliibacter ruber]|uniref:Type I restriction and modification enzyme subunit R-like protein n=1 Tax=Mongoliibacter ruber TaxID=1750599 RepID=A0A2T0WMP5_9BACT|nr:type I restriction enzyme HsdR N-terminal domain-containing protein [Mongoliibacter ruber]PRY87971.1 type I restriction and modification enzyme subunit R-like protein [Mongoliibacter ruber]
MSQYKYDFLKIELNFPEFEFRLEEIDGKLSIFDSLRKKNLILTPEEWVRQHMIAFLIEYYNYPKSLISLERGHKYNQLQKRSDILVLNRSGNPFLLIECKAPEIELTQKTVEQVSVYNQTISAPFVGISNGIRHLFLSYDIKGKLYKQIAEIPQFDS